MSYPDATFDDYPELVYEIPNIVAPKIRVYDCPQCHLSASVRAIRLNHKWHYRGKCPICSTTWSNLYKVQTQCSKCGELTFCTEKNKFGACQSCIGKSKGKKFK